jgi:Skp family chaperone for outer membrane proteins
MVSQDTAQTPGPSDQDLLHHLLEVEAHAATLVEDAQAEGDRRITEHETQRRAEYDETYAREAAELEERYQREYKAVKTEYQQRLDAYRGSLETMPVYRDKFFKLVSSLLFGEC